MLVATIGLCSVLIAIGMFFAFLRWIAKPQPIAQKDPAVQVNQPRLTDPVEPTDPLAANTLPGTSLDGGANQPGDTSPPVSLPLAGDNKAPSTTSPDQPAVMPPDGTAVSPTGPAETPAVPPANTPTTIGNATATKRPLGSSIAPDLDAVLGNNTPTSEPKGDAPLELPPGLHGFSQLFSQGFEPVLPDASVPLDKPAEVADNPDKIPADPAKAQPAAPTVDPVPANVDKLLKNQLSGVLINKRPLSEALTTLSLISDVPTVADLDALAVVGVTNSTLVEVRATTGITVDGVLKAITDANKFSFVPWENRVLYARASEADLESRVPDSLPIADLVSDEPSAINCCKRLRMSFPNWLAQFKRTRMSCTPN